MILVVLEIFHRCCTIPSIYVFLLLVSFVSYTLDLAVNLRIDLSGCVNFFILNSIGDKIFEMMIP